MSNLSGKVVLVTGASSGIGKALAEFLKEKGCKVYGTSRKASADSTADPAALSGSKSGFIKMIQLDVHSEESIKKAIDYIIEREISIDILVNNAGFGIAGSVEDTTAEEAYSQFDTNFFGVLRMCRAVAPIMREQKGGRIVNVSSVAGLLSIPFQSMYSASKYALEAMTEAMRIEMKPFGIKVAMVEPGDTKTGFTDKRIYTVESNSSVYKDKFIKSITTMEQDERKGPDPTNVVKAIVKAIEANNPPIRITVGFTYKLIVFLKRILPSRLVEYILGKIYAN